MREKILKELREIELLEGNIKEETHLKDFLDSLERIEVIIEVEKKFNIHISDSQIERIKTIGDIIDIIPKSTK